MASATRARRPEAREGARDHAELSQSSLRRQERQRQVAMLSWSIAPNGFGCCCCYHQLLPSQPHSRDRCYSYSS